MNNLIKFLQIFIVINLLSSCQFIEDFKLPEKENVNEKSSKSKLKNRETLEIRISCGNGNLKEFLDKGWKVKREYSEEKVCSWKSVPANKKLFAGTVPPNKNYLAGLLRRIKNDLAEHFLYFALFVPSSPILCYLVLSHVI